MKCKKCEKEMRHVTTCEVKSKEEYDYIEGIAIYQCDECKRIDAETEYIEDI